MAVASTICCRVAGASGRTCVASAWNSCTALASARCLAAPSSWKSLASKPLTAEGVSQIAARAERVFEGSRIKMSAVGRDAAVHHQDWRKTQVVEEVHFAHSRLLAQQTGHKR